MSAKPPDRLIWLDVARGAGIVMVVAGHSFNDPLIRSPIFLFHMPLFFMLAGFTMKGEPLGTMLGKRVPSLLVPYACWFMLVTLIDIALGYAFNHPVSLNWNAPLPTLETALYGGQLLKGSYAVFWFITCLFLAQMAFGWLLMNIPRLIDWRWAVVLGTCLALTYLSDRLSPSPWNVAIAPAAMIFLYAGQALRHYGERASLWVDLGIATLAIGSLFLADPLDMKYAKFGTPGLSLIAALALSYTFVRSMQAVARVPYLAGILAWIGGASLTVMFVHMTMIFHFHAALGPLYAFLSALAFPLALYPVIRTSKTARRLLLGGR